MKILMGMSGITTSSPHDREHSRRRKQAGQDFYRQIRPAFFFFSHQRGFNLMQVGLFVFVFVRADLKSCKSRLSGDKSTVK